METILQLLTCLMTSEPSSCCIWAAASVLTRNVADCLRVLGTFFCFRVVIDMSFDRHVHATRTR